MRSLSSLAQIRVSCPVLGAIVEEFAMQDLGESFPTRYPRSRACGGAARRRHRVLARRAREARDAGATMRDFEEALYLTAVTVGVPRPSRRRSVLLDVFAERDRSVPGQSVRAGVSF